MPATGCTCWSRPPTGSSWAKASTQISVRYELKLSNSSMSQVRARMEDKMIRPQDRIPADNPGRGITSAGDVIRFAVGRIDSTPTMDDLDTKVRETVATRGCPEFRGTLVAAR